MANFAAEVTGPDFAAALSVIEDMRAGRLPRPHGALSTAGLLTALTYIAASTLDVLDPQDADEWVKHMHRQALARMGDRHG